MEDKEVNTKELEAFIEKTQKDSSIIVLNAELKRGDFVIINDKKYLVLELVGVVEVGGLVRNMYQINKSITTVIGERVEIVKEDLSKVVDLNHED